MTALAANDAIREAFVLWALWSDLAQQFSREHPTTVDPHDIYGRACAADHRRLVSLMYGMGHGGNPVEAGELLAEVLAMAADGRRPRFGRELGLTRETLGLA
jgi:hypothetical protein